MKRKRFSEERIISILKEYEAGVRMADLSRKHGVSEQTLYRLQSKYGGMSVSEARRLRRLESENAKLKHCQAAQFLGLCCASRIPGEGGLIQWNFSQ